MVTTAQEKSFLSWMRENNQLFVGDDYHTRLGIWLTNSRLVKEHNRGKSTFKVSLNSLAALTPAEYRAKLGLKGVGKWRKARTDEAVPTDVTVDWRTKGVVNPIQDQGQCGSCWAFGAIQGVESAYAIQHGQLYKLSEQNIVDCVDTCFGCKGGWHDWAIDYVVQSQDGKIDFLSDYPYVAIDQNCAYDDSSAVQVSAGYIWVNAGDEGDLATKVQTIGVAAVGIDAFFFSFQFYTGGIYDEPMCSSTLLDHAVGVVGFGSEDGVNYWIVRNSWGISWGEQGYIRMVKDKRNQCGEATHAILPTSV